ncbi:MAG: TatD family hydrolase [Caldilineaceae bacterium]
MIDSHCHIDLEQFDADRADVLQRARAAGVGAIVIPGIDLAQNRGALVLAEGDAGLFVAVGVHPNSADSFGDDTIAVLRDLAAGRKVVAIGEIGLDYYWDKVAPEQQRRAFVQQLDLAAKLGLPVIIHSRDANDDVADVLRTWVSSEQFRASPLAARTYAGVLHAFSGDLALAEEAYAWGFVLSLGGPVTFRNAHPLHALVPKLRLDRLMVETDAPYLTPHPWRGQRNEPAHIPVIVERLASLYGATPAEVVTATTAVAQRFFQLEDRFGADVTERNEVARV